VVSQAEAEIINHFLRTVCPPNTYSKLNLDAILAQKQHRKGNARICQDDSYTAEAKLALACLELLIENSDGYEEGLLPYARKFFDHHLGAADLAFVDIELKVQIGQLLVKLFTHDESIDTLVCTQESSRFSPVRIEMCEKLLLKNDTADTVIQWLKDSAVTSEVSDKETREWISDVIKDGGPGKLLAPAAKRMAWHLAREPHLLPVTRGAFLFLVYYIRKVRAPFHGHWHLDLLIADYSLKSVTNTQSSQILLMHFLTKSTVLGKSTVLRESTVPRATNGSKKSGMPRNPSVSMKSSVSTSSV
jgi:hypothetical protein